MRKKSLGFILIVLLVGGLLGSALGKIIAYLLPAGVVKQFFLESVTASLGPGELNIVILSITFGLSFDINIVSVIGILITAYFLRWVE